MAVTTFDFLIWLKIETEEDIDFITDVLNLKPTDSIQKGERKSKVLAPAESNIWIYGAQYRDCTHTEGKMSEFLEGIPLLFRKIEELRKIGIVTIRISLVSEFAQIGANLSEKDLLLLSRLQIPLEISVFSWGGCIDE